ncbi:MAG: mannonate dehydratase [Anaerolineaceae bacterium]|nr:mannonate dehydratase [Anaerolineaceae bacterium]
MIEIAEALPPTPTNLWQLCQQAGVSFAVGGLPTKEQCADEYQWDLRPLQKMKQGYEEGGFTLSVIEARPPLEKAKRGQPGRDEEIAAVCTLLENMSKIGVNVWCYEWMAGFNWVRTSTTTVSRGGSIVTSYDHTIAQQMPPPETGPISEEALWENLQYFLQRVLPVAEKVGVKLSMHPDDPPISPLRGVGRIMRSVDNYQRLLDMAPSPMNTITMCQGNFTLMTDDLPGTIRHFGKQDKISFVHFRDVRGNVEKFEETWHDEGKTNLLECMKAYKEIDFNGVLRPDHVPTVAGDSNLSAGYSSFGRLYAIGYIRGLRQAVYAEN